MRHPGTGVSGMNTGRIVVGVDGSDSSRDALRWARAQADILGADLEVVGAWAYPAAAYPTLSGFVPMGDTVDMEAETLVALQTVVKETLGDDARVKYRVVEGHPAKVLVDLARGALLCVVGCRGHGGFVGALLGSVSQHVVAHATCPVVVIRHPRVRA
jgi:nucleotide-binding universal stress UspA family protein